MPHGKFHTHYQYQGPVLIKDFDFVKSVLRAHEGRKLKAYNPGDKHPTISTGFNLDRKDAARVLKACGIPHKVQALKTSSETLTPAQAQRLENYVIHEAAIIAATQLGGDRFTKMSPARQAAAISLAANSPVSMKEVAGFIKKDQWDDNFLQGKASHAEKRDHIKYTGIHVRYTEIQDCLKKGDFPESFYKKYKIPHPQPYEFEDPMVFPQVLGSLHLLSSDKMDYLQMMRDKAFSMANAVNGPLGDQLKNEALKIGIDGKSPLTHLSNMMSIGMAELKAPKSQINLDNLQEFTKHGACLLSDLAKDHVNIAHCVGLSSGSLGFDDAKLSELAEPFLNAAACYQTAADSMNDLNSIFSKTGIGDTSQPLSAFNYGTGKIFQEVPNKVSLLDQQLEYASESFSPISTMMKEDDAPQTWSKVFNGVASAGAENIVIDGDGLSKKPSLSEYNHSDDQSSLRKENLSLGRTLMVAQSAAQFIGVLCTACGKSDVGAIITSIAVPALSIAATLCTWGTIVAVSGPAAPYVALAGAMATLVMGIAALCKGPQGPTPDEIILRQLERLTFHMDKRFDRIEKYIEGLAAHLDVKVEELRSLIMESHKLLSEAIHELKNDINKGFAAIYDKLNAIQTGLEEIARRHETLFTDTYTQEFKHLLLFSHLYSEQELGQQLNPNDDAARRKLIEYYQRFYAVLTVDASSDTLAGSNTLTEKNEANMLATILRTAHREDGSYGYETSINSIAAYSRFLDPKINKKRYVNPFVWATGSKGLINFVMNNHTFLYGHAVSHVPARKLQHEQLNLIQTKGNELKDFILQCQTNKVFWEKLFENYESALRDVVVALYVKQWPSSAESEAHSEDANATQAHATGLNVLSLVLADYISGLAGPDNTTNRFHASHALPDSLAAQFPNPGYHIFAGLFVHNLRASEIRFHDAHHMRTIGREMLRPYLDQPAIGDSLSGCEDAVKGIHTDMENEVNRVKDDQNAGGNYDFGFATTIKQNINAHQNNWLTLMNNLRDVTTAMASPGERTLATNYAKALLSRSAAKLSKAAAADKQKLPDRDLMKRAYEAHANGALDVVEADLALVKKLDALDDHATLLRFFIEWLLPMYPELKIYYKEAFWTKSKVIAELKKSTPCVITLHNLIEREHVRLKTHLEIFKDATLKSVEEITWRNKKICSIASVDVHLAEALDLLEHFEKLYFTVHELKTVKARVNTSEESSHPEQGYIKGEVPGDGNCFFSSVSMLLEHYRFPKKTAAQLRSEAVDYLRKDKSLHVGFGPDEELGTLDDFCAKMQKDKEWAEGPVIDALAKMLNVELVILDFVDDSQSPTEIRINENATRHLKLVRDGQKRTEHYSPAFESTSSKPGTPVKEKMTHSYNSKKGGTYASPTKASQTKVKVKSPME